VSLYDRFNFEWTLLRLGRDAPDGSGFVAAARARGVDLKVVEVEGDETRDLYEANLALIRPDQIVAWRGGSDAERRSRSSTGRRGSPPEAYFFFCSK
jgi:hypothetical protein